MEIILFGDIFDDILPMLIPIDLYNLVQTCKIYQQKIKMSHIKLTTINEINRRLFEMFEDDFDSFKKAMRESDATISGSFIVQCILGEKWSNNVNIYVSSKIYGEFIMQTKQETINILEYMREKYELSKNSRKEYDKQIIGVSYVNGKQIRFINIQNEKIESYMKREFDFNICKNSYVNNNVKIYQINEIFTRHTNFAPKYDLIKNMNRYIKYHKRGFNFYLDTRYNLVTNHNIWDNFRIDIIKVTPIKISYDKCGAIMTGINNNFTCIENIISFGHYKTTKYVKILEMQNTDLIVDMRPCRCGGYVECLFKYIYPNISHLHSCIYKSCQKDGVRDAIYVLDNFIIK
uniref:Uncharacterized protein n=1 Tax=viral metagenome TaxID=1070528 RepID=A0A6C0CB15_9ZZZZ